MRTIFVGASILLLLAFSSAATAAEEAVSCVDLKRVSRTEVLDDRNVLFHMLGGTVYRNELTHRCPGLNSFDPVMYRTTTGRVCNVDTITVLQNVGGGFMPGATCGLGTFVPVDEDEIELLKEGNARPRERVEAVE